ncbi:hypothetical protein RSAG8_06595, partial [Rhizoctonia solani AG-8 WAC10335]
MSFFQQLFDTTHSERLTRVMQQESHTHPDGHQDVNSSGGLEPPDALNEASDTGVKGYAVQPVQKSHKVFKLNPAGRLFLLFVSLSYNPSASMEQACSSDPQSQYLSPIDRMDKMISQEASDTPYVPTEELQRLAAYAQAYMDRFESSKDSGDADIAIDYYVQAISLASLSDTHPDKPGWYLELGNAYYYRFQRLGREEDIDKAVECQKQATSLIPNGGPIQSASFYDLGVSYNDRFELRDEISDLHDAIDCLVFTNSLTRDAHEGKAERLGYLGNLYQTRFERLGNASDANNAIDCLVKAVSLSSDSDAHKPLILNHIGNSYRDPIIGNSYRDRFNHSGNPSDIRHSIEFLKQSLSLIHEGHEGKPGMLSNLGSSYQSRFEQLGDPGDLDEAIECTCQALLLTPGGGGFNRLAMLNNLGFSYRSRFDYRGTHSDLDRSIDHLVEAIHFVPVGHSFKPVLLNNLGNSYQSRFECLGELSDASHAISYFLQAVSLTPDGHPEKSGRLNNLGNALCSRFARAGDLSDIDGAIQYLFRAISLTPEHHPDKPKRLNNLAISYRNRFLYSNELSDKSVVLTNLGNAYRGRFEQQHQHSDISESIDYLLRALELTPEKHARRPVTLQSLGGSYQTRFRLLGTPLDIKYAIEYHTQAVALTQDSDARKPSMLIELGNSYHDRLGHLLEPRDLENAIICFQRASESSAGPPYTMLKASRQWARLAYKHQVSDPLAAYKRALELIPQIIGICADSTIDQRYRPVREIGDLAVEAASCAILLKDFDHALEWLEQGRSIVWNQILKLRDPFDKISASDPTLAQALGEVGRELEKAGSRVSAKLLWANYNSDIAVEARRHRHLASEWDRLLRQARCLPGCESFLQPQRAKELKRVAKDGPVVVINIYEKHCDGLIILPGNDQISHIPLKDFSRTKATNISEQLGPLIGHRGSTRLQAPARSGSARVWEESLRTLWSDVAKPVLDFLGCTSGLSNEKLPHVTWCTTGRLSFLPLHAAGSYNQSSANVFDLVVSSYTPTLSALLLSSSSVPALGTGVLAIGQEETPGFASLPYTQDELRTLKGLCKSVDYMELSGNDATTKAVIDGMEKYSWVHLACHATQHVAYPTHSAFHLCDGSLNLLNITQKAFKNKGLAFLSACHTAAGDKKLPDEAVHLAAGMLMAGYPSVIATMWSMRDIDGPEMAAQIYTELLKDGKLDYTGAARALHGAVKKLRDRVGVTLFSRWMPFVHFGS